MGIILITAIIVVIIAIISLVIISKRGIYLYLVTEENRSGHGTNIVKVIEKVKVSNDVDDLSNLYIPAKIFSMLSEIYKQKITGRLFVVIDYMYENRSIVTVLNENIKDRDGIKLLTNKLAIAIPMILPVDIYFNYNNEELLKKMNQDELNIYKTNFLEKNYSSLRSKKFTMYPTPSSTQFIVGMIMGSELSTSISNDVLINKLIIT